MLNYSVASMNIGDWRVAIEEEIDTHNGEVYDRTFAISKADMRETFHSLIEAVEFAQSMTGNKSINGWAYVEQLSKQAQEFYLKEGIK